ncbi:ion transporter [Nonlabens marinus]|uniref:Potassium voltage-gated channel subfamily KQT n=1 Tax=Nonlabens marinus S1-08 TaxID=1454201 RepID=W8VXG6_9FLAO|nr:ion transporter [Nonlabens marinus]BAO55892.1 potassium voltage-gated channel subfamily KQT [Nonlabens marinus S1-08]
MPKSQVKPTAEWRRKLHEIIYEADTPAGKLFDVLLLVVIIISVILVLLESVPSLGSRFAEEFIMAEWVITIFFTIEYVLRIVTINKPSKYIFSFYGIIDLLSTAPLYLTFFLPGGYNALLAVRSLRLLRVFRILKITRFIGEADKLSKALKSSFPKILVFLFAVLVISIIMGTLMYLVEGADSGFVSIPVSIYWCIVTLTTVGFGDIAPVTPMGQFLASVIMIMGYGIIAVPTGIVSAEYTSGAKDKKPADPLNNPEYRHVNTQVCQNCLAKKHQDGATYCHKCGYSL